MSTQWLNPAEANVNLRVGIGIFLNKSENLMESGHERQDQILGPRRASYG